MLTFVITWMDGAFKSSEILAKMECELERKRKKTEERKEAEQSARAGRRGLYRKTFSTGLLDELGLKVHF